MSYQKGKMSISNNMNLCNFPNFFTNLHIFMPLKVFGEKNNIIYTIFFVKYPIFEVQKSDISRSQSLLIVFGKDIKKNNVSYFGLYNVLIRASKFFESFKG